MWFFAQMLFILAAFTCFQLQAIHNAQNLSKAYSAETISAKRNMYKRLLNATGNISMINSDPITETTSNQNSTPGLSFTPFDRAGCSAVHFKNPAYFITSAQCFLGTNYSGDPFRRYGRVHIEGKPWDIDPLSIIIHHKYGMGTAESDLAIFSLERSQEAYFDKLHNFIPTLPQGLWITEGQLTHIVGYGATTELGDDYGTAYIKDFIQLYPDAEDRQEAAGNLEVSPHEQVLTFVTHNTSKGVICPGDSGGGAFIKANLACDGTSHLYLQSVVIGTVGPDGNIDAPCEEISKYVVSVDLRFEQEWIEKAIQQIAINRAEAQTQAQFYADSRKALYNAKYFNKWFPVPKQELDAFIAQYSEPREHQLNQELFRFMQKEEKRRAARQFLAATHLLERNIPPSFTPFSTEDPWGQPSSDWVTILPSHAGELADALARLKGKWNFVNMAGTTWLNRIRVRNIGEQTIEFDSLKTKCSPHESDWSENTVTLKPGEKEDFWLPRNDIFKAETLTLNGVKGETQLQIYAQVASASAIKEAERLSWKAIVSGHNAASDQLDRLDYQNDLKASQWNKAVNSIKKQLKDKTKEHNAKYGAQRENWYD